MATHLTTTTTIINSAAKSQDPVGPPAGSLSPGGLGCGCGGIGGILTFSARTCLELLPQLTEKQIDTEIKHIQALDPDINFRTRSPTIDVKRDKLHKVLARSLCTEIDNIVKNYDTLISNISCAVEEAKQHVADVASGLQMDRDICGSYDSSHTELLHPGNTVPELETPVRFLDLSFNELSADEIVQTMDFKHTHKGGRKTAYYGAIGYSYGRTVHEPAEYPDSSIFNNIFNKLQSIDSTITKENYTCLVTWYPDGNSVVPLHSDNEKCIEPGSQIYTISVGATRTLKFSNMEGPLQEQMHALHHGSIHAMSSDSQAVWRHSILRDPAVSTSRVSFTIRRLVAISPEETKQDIPPITPPSPPTQDKKQKRVLLITDSVHSSMPTFLFDSISDHVCIKKVNYKLTDLDPGFSGEFAYTDIVIVSCGVNDLSRYGHTANSLADIMCKLFKQYSFRYPNTKFIFNSLLLTRDHKWLNTEIKSFNRYMFDLSRNTRNIYYFDSDRLVAQCGIKRIYSDSNGIHVSLDVRKLVARELVNSVGWINGSRAPRFQSCGWLRNMTARSSWAG